MLSFSILQNCFMGKENQIHHNKNVFILYFFKKWIIAHALVMNTRSSSHI